jgi:hypothetical protein
VPIWAPYHSLGLSNQFNLFVPIPTAIGQISRSSASPNEARDIRTSDVYPSGGRDDDELQSDYGEVNIPAPISRENVLMKVVAALYFNVVDTERTIIHVQEVRVIALWHDTQHCLRAASKSATERLRYCCIYLTRVVLGNQSQCVAASW